MQEGSTGANAIYKKSQILLKTNGICPKPVLQKISDLVRSRGNILTVPRLATKRETEDLETIENRKIEQPHYIDEPIAELDGLEVLYKENNLREILVKNITQNLNEFKKLDIDQMSYRELKHWVIWKNTVDSELEKADFAISRGLKLLNLNNLKKLSKIPLDKDEKALFKNFLKAAAIE